MAPRTGVTDSEEYKARAQYRTTSREEDEKNKGAPHVRVLLPSSAVPVTGRPPPHQLTPMTHHPCRARPLLPTTLYMPLLAPVIREGWW